MTQEEKSANGGMRKKRGVKPVITEGDRFHRWTVVSELPRNIRNHRVWECRCECGNIGAIADNSLKTGNSKSCGCYSREASAKRELTHGASKTDLYHRWFKIKRRCTDPRSENWSMYGGRGIQICESWSKSFENFLSDMGEPPTPKHQIDRIDNNGHYSPDNCRWVTSRDNCRNTRRNIYLSHNGEKLLLLEWADKLNVPVKTLYNRCRKGWSHEKILFYGNSNK